MARVLCGGVEYRSLSHAIDATRLSPQSLKKRLADPGFPDWQLLEPIKARTAATRPQRIETGGGALGKLVEYPRQWPDDQGERRERVLDPDDGRLVAVVGWRSCLCCGRRFFSEELRSIRLCPTCKSGHSDDG